MKKSTEKKFNILLIIGVASSISPINYSLSYNLQMSILLFATLILELYPFIRNKNKMGRLKGSVYILLYIMYMILLFIK